MIKYGKHSILNWGVARQEQNCDSQYTRERIQWASYGVYVNNLAGRDAGNASMRCYHGEWALSHRAGISADLYREFCYIPTLGYLRFLFNILFCAIVFIMASLYYVSLKVFYSWV